ncbi:MAG: protein phosphatase CheZ [Azoarcus sp.]|jgi:chemotaxis protein CheZ|nr:protein phosphatase CheZ [Azoarcus sp.]
MVAKRKIDETGDSDELQSLFDNIAAGGDGGETSPAGTTPAVTPPQPAAQAPAAQAPVAQPATAPAPKAASDGDDNDELQALFDSESGKYVSAANDDASDENRDVAVYKRIGKMTRKLHDMLIELGLDSKLQAVANSMPDTRQRLTYVVQMTEQAASKVLNAADIARPLVAKIQADSTSLHGRWDKLYGNQLSVEEFKALAGDTRTFLSTATANSQVTDAQLHEIIMAQDFQDLTGQVIKKVLEMAQALESQLLEVLIESAPEEVRTEKAGSLLNGPVTNSEGRDDVVTNQEQVDDLLASLGF